jgi:hypothetical protein
MEIIENRTFRKETVNLDGKHFVRCIFEGCLLLYSGERCEWEETTFSSCQITLQGTASHVLQVLQALGVRVLPEPDGVRFS